MEKKLTHYEQDNVHASFYLDELKGFYIYKDKGNYNFWSLVLSFDAGDISIYSNDEQSYTIEKYEEFRDWYDFVTKEE